MHVINAAVPRAFTFVQEFADARDADDARHYCNGKDFDGNRLIVEFARRVSRMMKQPSGVGFSEVSCVRFLG